MNTLEEQLSAATNAEIKLEYIGLDRPKSNMETTAKVHLALNHVIADIWRELSDFVPDDAMVNRVVHNTHCYIIGEVSNYISGRGLIENKAKLREYIVKESINMMTCCIRKG